MWGDGHVKNHWRFSGWLRGVCADRLVRRCVVVQAAGIGVTHWLCGTVLCSKLVSHLSWAVALLVITESLCILHKMADNLVFLMGRKRMRQADIFPPRRSSGSIFLGLFLVAVIDYPRLGHLHRNRFILAHSSSPFPLLLVKTSRQKTCKRGTEVTGDC